MDHKACIDVLENIKTGTCRTEKAAIDQAIDSVKKMHKIKKWIKTKNEVEEGVNPWQE